jgi:hypothetical protein
MLMDQKQNAIQKQNSNSITQLQRVQLRRPTCTLEGRLESLICPDQNDLHQCTASDTEYREGDHQQHRFDVAWFLACAEEVRAPAEKDQHIPFDIVHYSNGPRKDLPDIPRLSQNIDNRRRASPLLGRLTRRASTPCNTRLLPVKQPAMYRKLAKYLAGTFSVATEMMNPMIATVIDMVICQPRSLILSLLYAMAKVTRAPIRYGGAVQTRVIVLEPRLNPRTIDG